MCKETHSTRQVEELALHTWKTSEALFLEKERRSEARLQRAENKRKATKGTLEERLAVRAQTDLRGRGRKRKSGEVGGPSKLSATSAPTSSMSMAPHKHAFLPDETYDEARDVWTKWCECGYSVEYERI